MKKQRKGSMFYLFGRMWEYSAGNRKMVALYLSMLIVSELIGTYWFPIVWMKILNIVDKNGITDANLHNLDMLLWLLPLGCVLNWAFHGPARVIEEENAFVAKVNLRERYLKGVMNLPLAWHNEHPTGNTIDRIEKGSNAIYDFSSETFQFVKPIISLVGCFAAVVYFNRASAFIVALMLIIAAVITIRIDKVCAKMIKELNYKENKVAEKTYDSISNIVAIIVLRVENRIFRSIIDLAMSSFSTFKKNCRLNEIKWFLTNFCYYLMLVFVMRSYFHQSVNNSAVLSANVVLVKSFLEMIGQLFNQFTALYGWTVRRLYKLLNCEELSLDFVETSLSDHVLPDNWREIEIRNLNFTYPNGESKTPQLKNVNMKIKRGQKIAFVGSTGSGKTTMLSIIRQLYDPQSLELYVDGVLVKEGFAGISRAISLILQNAQLLSSTIEENITLGVEYDEDMILKYTDMACFTDVALALPHGFKSSVKERGVNLSGGQAQRCALSRGLLASEDKEIILADEPTSSLDVRTESNVCRNIIEGFSDRTVIFTIHRLHLLPMFDMIYMFENGQVVGSGNLSEILGSSPQFAELWNSQYETAMCE